MRPFIVVGISSIAFVIGLVAGTWSKFPRSERRQSALITRVKDIRRPTSGPWLPSSEELQFVRAYADEGDACTRHDSDGGIVIADSLQAPDEPSSSESHARTDAEQAVKLDALFREQGANAYFSRIADDALTRNAGEFGDDFSPHVECRGSTCRIQVDYRERLDAHRVLERVCQTAPSCGDAMTYTEELINGGHRLWIFVAVGGQRLPRIVSETAQE
jgi:hypothetical protein